LLICKHRARSGGIYAELFISKDKARSGGIYAKLFKCKDPGLKNARLFITKTEQDPGDELGKSRLKRGTKFAPYLTKFNPSRSKTLSRHSAGTLLGVSSQILHHLSRYHKQKSAQLFLLRISVQCVPHQKAADFSRK
jgi:hypothetical protein